MISSVPAGLAQTASEDARRTEAHARATVRDGSSADNLAIHVAGTIGASGVNAAAKGMVPAAAIEQDSGKYEANARDTDTLAVNAPYFLIFRSAGNDRFENPSPGQPVALTAGGTIAAGAAADDGDFDGDGLSNFFEYALGTNPRINSAIPAPTLDATGHLTLPLTIPKALPGVAFSGEATSDFVDITPVPVEVLIDADPQTIRMTDPVSPTEETRRFLWLKTTQ